MMQSTKYSAWFVGTFTQLKEGAVFEPTGSGKTFKKMGGLMVATDMESYEWIKTTVGTEFFNESVGRILHASPERFSRK